MNKQFNKPRTTRDAIRELNAKETENRIFSLVKELEGQGFSVSFGNIGKKTTYCLLTKDDEEIVGYTFVRDLKYVNEKVGMLKSLQQAVARKGQLEERDSLSSSEN